MCPHSLCLPSPVSLSTCSNSPQSTLYMPLFSCQSGWQSRCRSGCQSGWLAVWLERTLTTASELSLIPRARSLACTETEVCCVVNSLTLLYQFAFVVHSFILCCISLPVCTCNSCDGVNSLCLATASAFSGSCCGGGHAAILSKHSVFCFCVGCDTFVILTIQVFSQPDNGR